jgi:hypothetical protein
MTDAPIKVKNTPQASLLDDGSYLEMEFEGEDGKSITLGFGPDQLNSFLSRATQLVHEAHSRKAAKGEHFDLQPMPVAASMAQESAEGTAVIIAFQTHGGQLYPFAIPTEEATIFQNQVAAAVARARKQSKQKKE